MKKILPLFITILFAFTFNGWGQIISQYIETNSGTTPKGIEIWNNTGSSLDFVTNNLVIEKGTNGAAPSTDYTLGSGTLAAGSVIVIGTSDLQTITETNGSTFYLKPFTFNGDDALVVKYGGTITDMFGLSGNDPGLAWTGNGVSTADQNIHLKTGITIGDTDGWTDPSGRFEIVNTNPAGANGDEGFGVAPGDDGPNNPGSFSASVSSSSQIDLTFTTNATGDNVVIVYDADGSFSDPSGSPPVVGEAFAGGTLLYNGTTSPQNHSELTPGQTVYYKAWSYDDSDYSTGLTANATPPALIISEVSDPSDVYQARFVELYNAGESTIDFDTDTWYLSRQTNGTETWEDKQLTGSINSNETYVLANNNDNTSDHFYQNYNFMADFNYGGLSGNGDDGYFLYINGDHSSGTLIDAYGVIGEDGTGEIWEYEDDKAIRKNTIINPNTTWTASEWNIINTCLTSRMTPDSHPETVWNGSTSNDWTNELNWDNGLTGSTVNVKIWSDASNFPTITSGTNHCNNITISAGGGLNVHDGTLEIHGDVLLQSDANGSASIVDTITDGAITYSEGGTKTVQRYLVLGKYHYVSSPISSQNYSLFQEGLDSENDFFHYDETTNMWMNLFSASGTMEIGRGYAVQIAGSGGITKEFTGTLNTGNKTYSATYTPEQGGGVNLIGNPYPSDISALPGDDKSFLNKNSIVNTLYFWDEPASYTQQSNDYATYNLSGGTAGGAQSATPDGYISLCQGFFVNVSDAGDILFKNNMRSSHSAHFFKNDKSEIARVWISLTNSENDYNEILIAFPEKATKGVDNQYDGLKFKANQNLAFYSILNNEDYVIQGLPPLDENITIQLGVDVGVQGEHTFKLKDFENFSEGTSIILEDKQQNKSINLFQETEYTVALESGRIDERFLLHFTGPYAIDEISKESGINIYSFNNDVYIHNITNQKIEVSVSVKNILGQEILNKELSFHNTSKISLDVVSGYYFVNIISNKFISTKKVYIK